MRKLTIAALAALTLTGCEANGLSNRQKARDIQENMERICGSSREDTHRGGVQNMMLMDGSEDDGIVTCNDGTNHFFDG